MVPQTIEKPRLAAQNAARTCGAKVAKTVIASESEAIQKRRATPTKTGVSERRRIDSFWHLTF